jgi:hypothetical protein
VGVNLAEPDFMTAIVEQTKDLDINLVFNNAGFITTGSTFTAPLRPLALSLQS